MAKKYQGSIKVKRVQLQASRRDVQLPWMKEDEYIDEYFAITLAIANKMKIEGRKLMNEQLLRKILNPYVNEDPVNYDEDAKMNVWKQAKDDDISSIERNTTCELTMPPKGAKRIGVKWIYKTKFN